LARGSETGRRDLRGNSKLSSKRAILLNISDSKSAVSIPTNIAEGWGRGKTGEYVQFLRIARGSLMELETQLIISHRLNYIDQNTLSQLEENIEKIGKMINALIKNLGIGR
jgi:four helix bundle protein